MISRKNTSEIENEIYCLKKANDFDVFVYTKSFDYYQWKFRVCSYEVM